MERVTLTLQGVQLEAALDRRVHASAQPCRGSCCAPKPCKLLLLRPRGVAASATLSRRPLPGTLPVTCAQPLTLPLRRAAHTPPAGCPAPTPGAPASSAFPPAPYPPQPSRWGFPPHPTRRPAQHTPFWQRGQGRPDRPRDPGHQDDQPLWPRTGTDLLALRAVPLPGFALLGTAHPGYPPAVAAPAGAPPTLKATPSSRRRLRGSRGSGSRVPGLSPV